MKTKITFLLGLLCLHAQADTSTLIVQLFPAGTGSYQITDIHSFDHKLVHSKGHFNQPLFESKIAWPVSCQDTAIACTILLRTGESGELSINVPVLLERNRTIRLLVNFRDFYRKSRIDERLSIHMAGTSHAEYLDSLWKNLVQFTGEAEQMMTEKRFDSTRIASLAQSQLECLREYRDRYPGSAFWKTFLHYALATTQDEPARQKLLALLPAGFCEMAEPGFMPDSLLCAQLNRKEMPATFEFSLPGFSNTHIQSTDMRGHFLFVEFWATWCGPCLREQPAMRKLHADLKKYKKLKVISISIDRDEGQWKKYLAANRPGWMHLLDQGGILASAYGVQSIPNNFIVDPNGVVVARHLALEEAQTMLVRLLK